MSDIQYIEFEGNVVNKGKDYIDLQYSRNGEDGELDKSHSAISRFAASDVQNFDKVKTGHGKVHIAHAPLTEELLRYEQNKKPVEA